LDRASFASSTIGQGRSSRVAMGAVGPTVLRLAAPMLVGILAIVLFNVVDTFWVGQLGAHELAAMSYTFPVVMVVMSLAMGVVLLFVLRGIGLHRTDERAPRYALRLVLVVYQHGTQQSGFIESRGGFLQVHASGKNPLDRLSDNHGTVAAQHDGIGLS